MSKKPDECSDENIVLWLREKDPGKKERAINRAMGCLYERFYEQSVAWVKKRGGSEIDGSDALTDAIMSFAQAIERNKYEEQGSLSAFVMFIVRCKFFDICRKRKKDDPKGGIVSFDDAFPGGVPPELDWEDPSDQEEMSEEELARMKIVEDCLNQLGDRCKERITLYYHADLSHEEIAKAMGDANANVSKEMKKRCFHKLKECVKNKLKK